MVGVNFLHVLSAAIKSVAAAITLFAWAAGLGRFGFLDQKTVVQLSKISKVMFMPCLSFHSVAGGMDMVFIRTNWSIAVMGAALMIMGLACGHVASKFWRVPHDLRPWFVLAIGTPNMISLPLVLVEAICHELESKATAITSCVDSGLSRLFMYSLLFNYIFWGFGYSYASSYVNAHESNPSFMNLPSAPTIEESLPTASIGCPTTLEDDLKAEETSGNAATDHIAPSPVDEEDIMADSSPRSRRRFVQSKILRQCRLAVLDNPPVLASLLGLAVVFIPPCQRLLYEQGAPLSFLASVLVIISKASPAVTSVISGGTFGLQLLQLSWEDPLGLQVLGITRGAVLFLCFARIVLVPSMNLGILMYLDWLPKDPWSRLVIFFQPAGVTANVVTILAQSLDQPKGAQLAALVALPQMFIYVPVATTFLAFGMAEFENH